MKILTIIESLGKGGAERVLLTNLSAFIEMGHTCTVLSLYPPYTMRQELEENGIIVRTLDLKNRWSVREAVKGIRREVFTNNYDVIHAHLFFAHFYSGLAKIIYRFSIPTIVTLHNMGYDADPANGIFKKIRKFADGRILKYGFNARIAVSNAVNESFKRHLHLNDIKVIPNGFQLNHLQSVESIATPFLDESAIYIITPGRLVKEKGHRYLLDAIKQLNLNYSNLVFYFAGDGPLRNDLETYVLANNLQNVIFLGSLPQSELFAYISAANFVVIPSLSEGFPMVVGESMALSKAVITTTAGGIPDLIDHNINGIMVPPSTAVALQEEIARFLKAPEMVARLGQAAKKKAASFDIAVTSNRIIKLYKELTSCAE